MKNTQLLLLLLPLCNPVSFAATEAELADETFLDEEDFDDEFNGFYGSDEFISIATGNQKSLSQAPAVASVITAEQIRQSGARSLIDALKMVPGLNISRSSQVMSPKFNFRGITSTFNPQTLFMINGIPTKSVVRGDNHTMWGEHPIHSISRIEIIRGPGSALYGADAFAGVINVITKDADELMKGEVGVGFGNQSTKNAWFNEGFRREDFKLGLSVEWLKSDGLDETIVQDAQSLVDGIAAGMGIPAASHAPGPTNLSYDSVDMVLNAQYLNWNLNGTYQDRSDIGTGQGILEALDPEGRFGGSKLLLDLSHHSESDNNEWQVKTHVSYYGSEQTIEQNILLLPRGAALGAFPNGLIGNPGWQEQTTNADVKVDYTGLLNHAITFGLGYSRQDLTEVTESRNFNADLSPNPDGLVDVTDTPGVFIPEYDRSNKFLLVQDIWQLSPDWELTTGLRYDDYTDFGSTVNPRLSLVWQSGLNSTVKLLYGRAFRAPSFAELLTVNNPVSLGNPDIKPETIDSVELAYSFRHNDNIVSSINLFHYQVDDFITFVPDVAAPTSTAQNVGERTGYGLEAETGYSFSESLLLKANYSYVKAEDDLRHDDVGDYPNHMFKAELLWQISPQWTLNSTLNLVGERRRTPLDTREALDGFSDIGATLRYHTDRGLNIALSIDNLFHDDIREPSIGPAVEGAPVNMPFDYPLGGTLVMLRISQTLD